MPLRIGARYADGDHGWGGPGAQAGVLIKNAEALERFERVDTIVADKTGTLTEGKPRMVSFQVAAGFAEADVLRLAASLERGSQHPLGAAIVKAAEEKALPLAAVRNFDAPAGKGVTGDVDGHHVVIGNLRIMREAGIDPDPLRAEARPSGEGATAIFIAIDGRMAGVAGVADPIKATTPGALAALKAEGIRVVMLTGDNSATAKAVAKRLGITEVEAEVLPEDKAKVVERLRREGRVVAMAGDGVNDAPALAAADIGIAMGTGTDVAMESAGVTLLKGDLNGIVRARHLSAATMANIRQNSLLCLRLQRGWRARCRRRALSLFRHSAFTGHRRGGDGAVLGERDRQFAQAQEYPLVSPKPLRVRWSARRRVGGNKRNQRISSPFHSGLGYTLCQMLSDRRGEPGEPIGRGFSSQVSACLP